MLSFFADTDGDISNDIAREYGCHLISMPYCVDNKTIYPYVDFEKFDSKEFYDMLRAGALPTTSAIPKESYIHYFEPQFREGNDILYVHFSRAMTVTFDAMKAAVDELLLRYPERKFYEVDTKGITTISYVITRDALDMYVEGKSAEEIVEWAKTEVDRYAMYFFADDLKFFHHSGRVSGLKATMGTLLGVRPIICMSAEGKMDSIGTEKGRAKAMDRLLAFVDELGDDVPSHRVVIGHTDALELAQEFGEALQAKFDNKLKIEYRVVNPTAGAHCGPNGVGVCFHAIHR